MEDKQINELNQLKKLSSDDLLPISDSSNPLSGYAERLKNEKVEKILITQSRWDNGINPVAINCTCIESGTNIIDAGGEGIIARITALDIIKSVTGGNGSQVTYGISKDGGSWSEHINPEEAYVDYYCGDGVEVFVVVIDPASLCGAP